MATLTQLQARREALENAIASGVLRIREGDKDVTYRSLAEMKEALTSVVEQIAALDGTAKTRRIYPQFSKGW